VDLISHPSSHSLSPVPLPFLALSRHPPFPRSLPSSSLSSLSPVISLPSPCTHRAYLRSIRLRILKPKAVSRYYTILQLSSLPSHHSISYHISCSTYRPAIPSLLFKTLSLSLTPSLPLSLSLPSSLALSLSLSLSLSFSQQLLTRSFHYRSGPIKR
jgi:hypothetical protein